MRWFKHKSDMRNDLFVKELVREFGLEGRAIWNIVLEIYAEACNEENCGQEIEFSLDVFRSEIGISTKKLRNFLEFSQKKVKIFSKLSEKTLTLKIPKMLELRDEWTSRKSPKLGSHSGVTPSKNKEEQNKYTPLPPEGDVPVLKLFNFFEDFWKEYPRKEGKAAVKRYWERHNLDKVGPEIIAAVKRYKATEKWQKDGGRYIMTPHRFLNEERWNDEVQTVAETLSAPYYREIP